MKRLIGATICLIFILTSCSTNNGATIYITDGAYNFKPQELVDSLNREIEGADDSRYLTIPNYTASGESIEIDDLLSLTMALSENDSEYLSKITIDWTTFRETTERANTCAMIIGRLVGSISPQDSSEVMKQLDINASGSHEYTTVAKSNGTTYTYKYMLNGMYHSLTIEPTVGDYSSQKPATPTPPPPTQSISTDETATPSPSPSAVSNIKEFPLSVDGTVSSLSDALSSEGYNKLGEPKTSPGSSAELGDHTAYTYSLGDGAALVLYASDSTDNILNFTVLTVASEISDTTVGHTAFLVGCLIGGLAGDDAERVVEELGASNTTDDTFAMASTDLAEFMYMVQDGSLTLMITPA